MVHLNLNDHGNINDGVELNPALASLGQNFPNPFSRSTEINKGMMPAGKHTYTLETNNLDPGVYFYTLKAGSFVQTKQMVIVE